ncbi:hypothetical protein JOE40_003479 [Arthrobacter sp. PvP102]|nr:hypothetical protein [Arthrobacter sp. PvP103]MBP1238970.1 hypothetical protein [Arthrobacter sp. PvP102]
MLGRDVVESGPEACGLPQDRLIRRARAPIAYTTLDGNTAWSKSKDGTGEPWVDFAGAGHGFCPVVDDVTATVVRRQP